MPGPRATIVLVHGAWHGPWCWEFLVPHLLAQSLAVRALELPSVNAAVPTGLAEDARHLSTVLSEVAGPVVLCGHSYGGMVISAADTGQTDVRHLVYLCAYMTETGESVESSLQAAGERRPGHWIRTVADGSTVVDADRAGALFYQDCPDAARDWAVGQLRPHWGRALSDPTGPPAWRRHPSTYVVCSEDQALSPGIQREVFAPLSGRAAGAAGANVAELVDALDLGSSGVTREGSSPSFRTRYAGADLSFKKTGF
jgi:pimeloyl-ACP methyl ester carboxylesterase